jgi:hypothetical protein
VAAAIVVGATAAGTAEGVEVLLSTAWDLPPVEKELSHGFPLICGIGVQI